LLAHGWWFSPGILSSYTTKTGRHDIAETPDVVVTGGRLIRCAAVIGPREKRLSACIPCFFLVLEEIEWVVLWEALIMSSRGFFQNIVIILLVFQFNSLLTNDIRRDL
jgi:hypothetical protein